MVNGWRQYAPNTNLAGNLDSLDGTRNLLGCPSANGTNDTFSGNGQCVAGNVRSIRNRDNINGLTLRFFNWVSEGRGGWWAEVANVTWAFNGWKQTIDVRTSMLALRRG
jgi:hypothetical protein